MEIIYDILIKAYTGVILSLINLIRTYLFLNNNKLNNKYETERFHISVKKQ